MISPELVERMKDWRNEGFHAYTGEEIPDIPDALRVGLYMVRGPAVHGGNDRGDASEAMHIGANRSGGTTVFELSRVRPSRTTARTNRVTTT